MGKLARGEAQSEFEEVAAHHIARPAAAADGSASMVARLRLMMIVSGLTTLFAIAAVVGVIGYRVFRAGGSGVAATGEAIIPFPKGARVISTAVADERILVTLDIAGATEIRAFDAKTLKETGRIRFAPEP
jgi:hypothetical protein